MTKIIGLQAQNVLNLKAIELQADGKSVVLTGKNGAGKSAILDSIFMALTGNKVERPIRNGEESGQVTVTLDDLIVTKTYTASGVALKVTNREKNATYSSPQSLLNKILGDLTFNPIEFSELGKKESGKKEQRAILMRLAGLDFSEDDKVRENLYNERVAKNRELKRLEVIAQNIPAPDPSLPAAEISMADELAVVGKLEEQRNRYLVYLGDQENIGFDIEDHDKEISEIQDQIKELEGRLQACMQQKEKLLNEKASMLKPVEVTAEQIKAAKESLAGIEGKNRKIRQALEGQQVLARLADVKSEVEILNKSIDDVNAGKMAKIKAAQYPLEGLSVDDDGVVYKGVPLSQLSSGQRLQVSTAIAMALNPKLRIVLIRDASLLDKESLSAIVKMAEEKDYQLFIERTDESGQVGVFIEEGEIKAIDGQKVSVPSGK